MTIRGAVCTFILVVALPVTASAPTAQFVDLTPIFVDCGVDVNRLLGLSRRRNRLDPRHDR